MDMINTALGGASNVDPMALGSVAWTVLNPNTLYEPYGSAPKLRWESMRLASHHLYGSSRLGVAGYWSRQHDAFWNYEANTVDTVRLLDRLPWYSYALNAPMNATTTVEWGNGLTNITLASHFLGQKQFELTNHLGNPAEKAGQVVQVTVSDTRYVTLGQDESLHFSASVPAF